MVTFAFDMTIPDEEVPEVRSGLQVYFQNPTASDAELLEALRQEYIARLKNIVESTNRKLAVDSADAGDYTITVT